MMAKYKNNIIFYISISFLLSILTVYLDYKVFSSIKIDKDTVFFFIFRNLTYLIISYLLIRVIISIEIVIKSQSRFIYKKDEREIIYGSYSNLISSMFFGSLIKAFFEIFPLIVFVTLAVYANKEILYLSAKLFLFIFPFLLIYWSINRYYSKKAENKNFIFFTRFKHIVNAWKDISQLSQKSQNNFLNSSNNYTIDFLNLNSVSIFLAISTRQFTEIFGIIILIFFWQDNINFAIGYFLYRTATSSLLIMSFTSNIIHNMPIYKKYSALISKNKVRRLLKFI